VAGSITGDAIQVMEKARDIRPHSRPGTLAKLDQRTREARLLRETREKLIAHLGGKPSEVQRQMIERAAMLTLHVSLFDRRAIENGGLSERDRREYLAYSNSLERALRHLGIKAAAEQPPTLAEYLATRAEKAASEQVGDAA
jgi:hypothetical protein